MRMKFKYGQRIIINQYSLMNLHDLGIVESSDVDVLNFL